MSPFDVAYVRTQFPALRRTVDGSPQPTSTDPAARRRRNGSSMPSASTSPSTTPTGAAVSSPARRRTPSRPPLARPEADFLGCEPDEVSFGANMTTLTYLLAEALGRSLKPGDEVVISALDHEANRGPWLQLEARGLVVCEAPVDLATCTLDWPAFEKLVRPGKTKIVALGYASNAVGTVNDVARAAQLARARRRLERRRRRPLRAARPDRRQGRGLRLPALLRLQVLRPARRAHVCAPRGHRPGRAAAPVHPARGAAVRVGDRDTELRGPGGHDRRHRLCRRHRQAPCAHGRR